MKNLLPFLVIFFLGCQVSAPDNYKSESLELIRLSDHVYQHITYLDAGEWGMVSCNGILVYDQGEAIIFDTPSYDSVAHELIEWCREHLEGNEQDAQIDGLLDTWAHRDAIGCVDWWVVNSTRKQRYDGGMINRMLEIDIVGYAYLMDRPEMHFTGGWGGIHAEVMPGPERLPELAAEVVGKVRYHPGIPVDESSRSGLRRSPPGKCGWNELFEQVAIAWHAHSPGDCEAWLKGFSEEAQAVARARIENSDG